MVEILNKRVHGVPADAVYVGRPSMWGNPFRIGKDGTRREVVEAYEVWIHEEEQTWLRVAARKALAGRDLVCWCAPLACHAEVLAEVANADSRRGDRKEVKDE